MSVYDQFFTSTLLSYVSCNEHAYKITAEKSEKKRSVSIFKEKGENLLSSLK